MDLMDIVGFGASVASGGVLGLIGSVIGGAFKWLNAREEKKERDAQRGHEVDLLNLQMAAGKAETEQELALQDNEGQWNGLDASIKAERSIGDVHRWVNDVRALFRPLLTTGLLVINYMLFRDLMSALDNEASLVGQVLAGSEVQEILKYLVYSTAFSGSTAIVWWFGDRAMSPPSGKIR